MKPEAAVEGLLELVLMEAMAAMAVTVGRLRAMAEARGALAVQVGME
ncbi:hypothetical protein K7957_18575 [Sphingomonas yunnanensis]|nr:hypothetical protein [Sphingomonas yunnanensis]MBY9064945.1 hypothetical protein [Sphingomonas yunnanensis]